MRNYQGAWQIEAALRRAENSPILKANDQLPRNPLFSIIRADGNTEKRQIQRHGANAILGQTTHFTQYVTYVELERDHSGCALFPDHARAF
jgi:hypothetical protein